MLLLTVTLLSACSNEPTPEPAATPTPRPTATATPEPTQIPTPAFSLDVTWDTTWMQAINAFAPQERDCIRDAIDRQTLVALSRLKLVGPDDDLADEWTPAIFTCLAPYLPLSHRGGHWGPAAPDHQARSTPDSLGTGPDHSSSGVPRGLPPPAGQARPGPRQLSPSRGGKRLCRQCHEHERTSSMAGRESGRVNDRFPSWCVGQYRHVTTDEGIFLSL